MKEFKYSADGGSLMLGTEAFKAHYFNNYGDGEFTVFIDESSKDTDEKRWKYIDSVEGQFNVYDYDCGNAEILTTLNGRYGVYSNHGDMLLVKWN